jgi:sporulation protein YlmC with PRC-barrel domain
MRSVAFSLAVSALAALSVAGADVMTTVPSSSLTITDWYNQDVYDQSNTKAGRITDLLIDRDGRVTALVIGFGGLFGSGAAQAAVSFDRVKAEIQSTKLHLTMLLPPSHALAMSPAVMMTDARSSFSVTDWYKQSVYDQSDTKIGRISDVRVEQDGHVSALVIGVGGILGIGEKDVAISFDSVKATINSSSKIHLTTNSTAEELKAASRSPYDHDQTASAH